MMHGEISKAAAERALLHSSLLLLSPMNARRRSRMPGNDPAGRPAEGGDEGKTPFDRRLQQF